jgi:hypothetical protein
MMFPSSRVKSRNIAPCISHSLGETTQPEYETPALVAGNIGEMGPSWKYDKYLPAEAVKLVITVKNRRSVRNTIIMHNS